MPEAVFNLDIDFILFIFVVVSLCLHKNLLTYIYSFTSLSDGPRTDDSESV